MKKFTLIITSMFIFVSIFGQTIKHSELKVPRTDVKAVKETPSVISERQSKHIPRSSEGLWEVGYSWFAALSNSCARNTVSTHPSGDMVNVWTFLKEGAGAQRGTGYNWYDKVANDWDPIPEQRLENLESGNPGFPSHGFTNDGEVIVTHVVATSGLMILTRDQRGTGNWVQSNITDANYPNGLVWPTLATNGNTVHLMCLGDLGGENYEPLYFRSKDGGKNWDINAYKFPEVPAIDRNMFADAYVMISKGNKVVFFFVNLDEGNVGYLESTDDGDTWTHHSVYECNATSTEDYIVVARTGTAAIDDEGNVHVAFSIALAQGDGWYPLTTGAIVYWKSNTMSTLTPDYFEFKEEGDYWYLGYMGFPNVVTLPSVLGFNEFRFEDDVVGAMLQGCNNMGAIYDPRIVAEDGKVYLFFGSIIEQPMIYDGGFKAFYRGVFLTVSDDNGDTFNQLENTSWLSYNQNMFFCDWDEYLGPKDPNNPDLGYNGEIIPMEATENCWPTMAMNATQNKLLLQWANTYYPGTLSGDSYTIYTMVIEKPSAGVIYNTGEVWQGKWNDYKIGINEPTGGIQNMNIFPNPAQNTTTVLVNSVCSKPYSLSVSNMMGQVLQTQNGKLGYGENRIELNVNNFAPGVYFVNIKTDNATRTQKLIVK